MNAATKLISDLTTQIGQDHVVTGVLLVLGTNTQPSEPNTRNTQRKSTRFATYATPIRLMACSGQTSRQGTSGGWKQQPHRKHFR
jgi:hypothetical protein